MFLSLIFVGAVNKATVHSVILFGFASKLKPFWESITQPLGRIIGYTVCCNPVKCLLNYMDDGCWSKHYKLIIITSGMTVKRLNVTK